MQSLSFKMGPEILALILLTTSFSNGLDQCINDITSVEPTSISCNPSINVASSLPVICQGNYEIPLPNFTPQHCNATDRKWHDVKCYYSENVASGLIEGRHIPAGGQALVDGDFNTSINVNPGERSWDIWLGRQYAVYVVYVLFISQVPPNVRVDVQTRQQIDGTFNIYRDTECLRITGSVSERQRFVFYCLPINNTINNSQTISGRLTQNVMVTVNTRQMIRLAEILVYENQGLECGKPSQPGETVYNPNKSRYSVGEQVEYSCKDSSFVMFGSSTRYCDSDGRWAGYAPLCRQMVLLESDSFQMGSIDPILLDKNVTSCSPIHLIGKNNSNNSNSTDYEIRLQNRDVIIGQIHVSILENSVAIPSNCKMEMPSHPDIIFVRSNQSDDMVQDKSFNILLFVPHMRNSNENGGSSCHSNENLGQLIQYVLDSNAAPIIKLQCNAPTSLCEIRVNKVQDITGRCGVPEDSLNSKFKIKESALESVYTCNSGYRLVRSDGLISCADGRQWGRPPICERIYCRNYPPINIKDAGADLIWRLSPYSSNPGAIARYFHSDGSEPSPPVLRKCNSDGNWDEIKIPDSSTTLIALVSSGIIVFLAIVIILLLILRRRRNKLLRTSELEYFGDSSEIRFRQELPAGGPPLLPPNRKDSTIYEEIENFYDYDDIGKKQEGCYDYDDASKNHQVGAQSNDYSSKQLSNNSQSLFPRPPPVIPEISPSIGST